MTASPTFCILPWTHVSMESANLEYKMCCVAEGTMEEELSALNSSPRDALSSQYMNSVRKKMIAGQRVEACKACYSEEEASLRSMRLHYLNSSKHRIGDLLKKTNSEGEFMEQPKVEHLELRLGNLCNLKCVMCNPMNSSSYDDYEVIFERKTKSSLALSELNKSHLDQLQETLREVKQITFRGGEPLINKRHEEILEFIISENQASQIHLTYTTNGTVLPERLKTLWEKFKKVVVWVSVDGTGELNEFIRFPSKWTQIEGNLRTLDSWASSLPQLSWGITTTVQAYNLFALPALIDLTKKFSSCYPYPFINTLHYPDELRVDRLPKEKLTQAMNSIKDALNHLAPDHVSPIEQAMRLLKEHDLMGRKNKEALMSLVGYLDNLEGGSKEDTHKLKQLTDRILVNRKIIDSKFLKYVF